MIRDVIVRLGVVYKIQVVQYNIRTVPTRCARVVSPVAVVQLFGRRNVATTGSGARGRADDVTSCNRRRAVVMLEWMRRLKVI